MRSVTIREAKMNFSRLLDAVEKGEEIVITKANRPVARLVSYGHCPRRPGLLKGAITVADDFDAPLPEEVVKTFEGA